MMPTVQSKKMLTRYLERRGGGRGGGGGGLGGGGGGGGARWGGGQKAAARAAPWTRVGQLVGGRERHAEPEIHEVREQA
jgi:hypothetical protein